MLIPFDSHNPEIPRALDILEMRINREILRRFFQIMSE
jgi:hypothetical protein